MTTDKEESYLTPEISEQQEHLSTERLAKLAPTNRVGPTGNDVRPSANFIDLMNWTSQHFMAALKDKAGLEKFVHNRIRPGKLVGKPIS